MNNIEKGRDAIIENAEDIILEMEDGRNLKVTPIAMTEMNNKQYIAVLPEDSDEFWVYISEDHGETIDLISIEDEKEFDLVCEYFENMINDAYDEADDEEAEYEDENEE